MVDLTKLDHTLKVAFGFLPGDWKQVRAELKLHGLRLVHHNEYKGTRNGQSVHYEEHWELTYYNKYRGYRGRQPRIHIGSLKRCALEALKKLGVDNYPEGNDGP